MGRINVLGVDQDDLLELWDRSRLEYDAANALLLTGDDGQRRSAALHLFRGWHALASMAACRSGLPEPVLESFKIERGSKLLAPISSRRLSDWESSFESIRSAALEVSWLTALREPEERHLRLQARLLGHSLEAQRPRVARVPWRSRSWRVGWRKVLTAMAVMVLVVAAFDLGKRLRVSLQPPEATGDTAPTIPHDVYLSLEQLSEPKPGGLAWDDPGTVNFMNRVVISLGGVVHSETLSVSLDGNDAYHFSLMSGDETVGFVEVEPSWGGGLEVYTVTVPEEAISLGFDSIVIEAVAGDGAYAIGHLLLDPISEGNLTEAEGPG